MFVRVPDNISSKAFDKLRWLKLKIQTTLIQLIKDFIFLFNSENRR
jgi:hypothetical protein